jgi:hypothetical protein
MPAPAWGCYARRPCPCSLAPSPPCGRRGIGVGCVSVWELRSAAAAICAPSSLF